MKHALNRIAPWICLIMLATLVVGPGSISAGMPPAYALPHDVPGNQSKQTDHDPAKVVILPEWKIVDIDDTFDLTIEVDSLSPVDSLRSFFFSVETDTNVIKLDFDGTEVGDFFSQSGQTNFHAYGAVYYFDPPGESLYVYDIFDALNQPQYVSGYGDLARMSFVAVGSGFSEVKFRVTYLGALLGEGQTGPIAISDSVDAIVFVCPLADIWGDADGSGGVDIDDVVYLIQYIFAGGPEPIPHTLVGDVDCSEFVDIDDVVYLIQYIFAGGPPPCDPCTE